MADPLDLRAVAILLQEGSAEARLRNETHLALVLDRMSYAAAAMHLGDVGWDVRSRFGDLSDELGL